MDSWLESEKIIFQMHIGCLRISFFLFNSFLYSHPYQNIHLLFGVLFLFLKYLLFLYFVCLISSLSVILSSLLCPHVPWNLQFFCLKFPHLNFCPIIRPKMLLSFSWKLSFLSCAMREHLRGSFFLNFQSLSENNLP